MNLSKLSIKDSELIYITNCEDKYKKLIQNIQLIINNNTNTNININTPKNAYAFSNTNTNNIAVNSNITLKSLINKICKIADINYVDFTPQNVSNIGNNII